MKNKINYRLLNLLFITVIIYFFYLLKDFIGGVLNIVWLILKPFLIAFALSYVITPFIKFLEKKGIPKTLSIIIILTLIFSLVTLFIICFVPMLTSQIVSLFSNIIEFFNNIDIKYNIDLVNITSSISNYFNIISKDIGKFISDGAITFVNASINFVSNFIIVLASFIYFLFDMDKIRENIKLFCKKHGKKIYNLTKEIDIELTNYVKGTLICILIQFVEYTTLFYLIGHPNFLLLGIITSVSTIIPYFGGFVANIVAVITASVVNTKLLILTLIIALVCPNIDGYVINPRVYGKTNRISALLTIFAIFAGGVIDGFLGILIALPVTIIILTIDRNYKKDIIKKIGNIKDKI